MLTGSQNIAVLGSLKGREGDGQMNGMRGMSGMNWREGGKGPGREWDGSG